MLDAVTLTLAIVLGLAAQSGAHVEPPRILQIVREPLKTGREAEFRVIENEIAKACAALGCAHAYLGIESLTGPKEVWFFNGYASAAEKKQVAADYARNSAVMSALERLGKQKASLMETPIEYVAEYRPASSSGVPWLLGQGRFLVIVTNGASRSAGTVFEAADGTRFAIAGFRTRREADAAIAAAGPGAHVFAVRPEWSFPAREWVVFDPEFWRRQAPASE
jgi:hypothetical protein